jgi:AraC family transcriptional regulator
MEQPDSATNRLEAEMATACGAVQIVRRSWVDTIDLVGEPEGHRLELALLLSRSHGARGCFPDRWGPHRFEPIGELFLFPAGHRVHTRSECRQQASIVCTFLPDAARDWFDGEIEWTDARLRGSLDIANPALRNLLFRLGEEVRHPGLAGQALVDLMSAQIAIELVRHCLGIEEKTAIGGLAPWRLRLIDERLADADDCPTLAELAALCNLSVRQLTRGFRASRGRSIGSYIADSRIEQARRMLAADARVKTVAYAMGFASPSNFSVAFRRATGETPRQFRERLGRRTDH